MAIFSLENCVFLRFVGVSCSIIYDSFQSGPVSVGNDITRSGSDSYVSLSIMVYKCFIKARLHIEATRRFLFVSLCRVQRFARVLMK